MWPSKLLENEAYNLIYWIFSETEDSLIKSCKDLLTELWVPDFKTKNNEQILILVEQEITKPERGKCLLIYDNVPDPSLLKGKIPKSENTHILITSRCNQGWENPPLNLNVFRLEDSLDYLFNVTGMDRDVPENEKIAGDVAEALRNFPRALAHLNQYIKLIGSNEVSRNPLKEYLYDFQTNRPDWFADHQNPFKKNELEMTYEKLIQKNFSMISGLNSILAKKFMVYFSFLDPNFILEDIFLEYFDNKEVKESFEQLTTSNIIKKAHDQPLYTIDTLVQLVIRNELENRKEINNLLNTVKILLSIFKCATHKLISKNFGRDLALMSVETNLSLSPVFLGKSPTIDSLNSVEKRQLGLFAKDDKLYCKISGKEQIELTPDNNATEATQKGLPRNIFNKIKEALVAFDFAVIMEAQGAPVASQHYNDAIEYISGRVWASLLQFISLNGYIPQTVQSLNKISMKINNPNIFEEKSFNKYSARIILEQEIDSNFRIQKHLEKILEHLSRFYRFEWMETGSYIHIQFCEYGRNFNKLLKKLNKMFFENVKFHKKQFCPDVSRVMSESILRNQESIINATQLLITDGMDEDAKAGIIEVICMLEARQRLEIAEAAKLLITDKMNKKTLKGIIEALEYVYTGQRKEVAEVAKLLMTDEMDGETQAWIITALRNILPSKRLGVGKATKLLMTERMDWLNLSHIMGALENVEPSWLQEVIEDAKSLINETMSGWDQSKIIDALARLESRQRQEVIEATKQLITKEMTGFYRAKIIDALARVEPKWLQKVMEAAKLLIIEGMDESNQAKLVDVLARIELRRLQDVIESSESLINERTNVHAGAQYNLGWMYLNVLNKENEAFTWFTKAAEQGNAKAQYYLGLIYVNNQGVNRDDFEALKWLSRAAKQGHAKALEMIQFIDSISWCNLFIPLDDFQAELKLEFHKTITERTIEVVQQTSKLEIGHVKENTNAQKHLIMSDCETTSLSPSLPETPFSTTTTSTTSTTTTMSIYSSQPTFAFSQSIDLQDQEKVASIATLPPQPQFLPNTAEKIENSVPISSHGIKDKYKYTLQGDFYASAAIQHASEGNESLAKHLAEEADKKYKLADDAILAEKLQAEENHHGKRI